MSKIKYEVEFLSNDKLRIEHISCINLKEAVTLVYNLLEQNYKYVYIKFTNY